MGFLLKCIRKLTLSSLRTVRAFSYYHAFVRITPGHEKTGMMTGRFPSRQTIYAVARSSQPPDYRTYSAEVTSFLSNLPHHRRLRPNRRLAIIQQHPRVCQALFKNFLPLFLFFLALAPHIVFCVLFPDLSRGKRGEGPKRPSPLHRLRQDALPLQQKFPALAVQPQDIGGSRVPIAGIAFLRRVDGK